MASYQTHTPLESRKITPLQVSKYRSDKQKLTMEDHVQQYLTFLKYDGVCAILFVHENGSYYMQSRTKEEITNFKHIDVAHENLPFVHMAELLERDESRPMQYKSGVYFGELWHPDMSATTIGGLNNISDPDKYVASAKQRQAVSFVVWDFVTWAEWQVGVSNAPFSDRIRRLDWMQCIGLPGDPSAPKDAKYPPIFVAPCEGSVAENKDFTSINEMAEFAKTQGRYDGIILVDPEGAWKRGERDLAKIKVKPTVTVDVEVVGYELGKGKYANVIGKVLYRYKDQVGKCSGMADYLRGVGSADTVETYFDTNWRGRIIEVEAMEESAHGKLREPRFKRFREGIDGSDAE